MSTRARVPALGAEGWFTVDGAEPALVGERCGSCGTFVFPRAQFGCPNPGCGGSGAEMVEVELSRRGRVWSYTDARYEPPAPYVVPGGEHEPFALAAVELEREGLVVLGQVVAGVGVDDLRVGQEMELVVDVLFSDEEADHLIWKWRPVDSDSSDSSGGSGVVVGGV